MNVPRRKIIYPQRFGCYEKYSATESDDENPSKEYCNRKVKKKDAISLSLLSCNNPIQEETSENKGTLSESKQLSHHDLSDNESLSSNKKHGAKAYICDECGKVLRSKDTLERHKISHKGLKPFICDICNKDFSSAVSLKEHKAKHENKMLYECAICSKKFRQNSCYCRHMQTHSKIAPHVCHICNRRFTLKDYLRSHMKKHTGEKKHCCSLCKKSFAHQSDLNRHKITHTGDRPYKCDVCGLNFTDNSSCRRHMKEHSVTSKLHSCNHCSLEFTLITDLQKHVEKSHIASDLLETDSRPSVEESTIKEDNFPSVEQLSISEVSVATDKTVSMELIEYRNFLEPDAYIDLDSSLHAPSSPVCRESLSLSSENIRDSNYRYFPDIDIVEKSNYSTVETIDYVMFPDFSSQNYYTWLSDFTSLCKLLTFPIEHELFNKISQVYKSIVDVLANPIGVLCNKTNFKVLKAISQDLLEVTNGHINFIYDHLQE